MSLYFTKVRFRAWGEDEGFGADQQAPYNIEIPFITGATAQGSTLTAHVGLWGGTDPLSYSYQWYRCFSGVCTEILGETTSTYASTVDDVDYTIKVQVCATNAWGGPVCEFSDEYGPITAAVAGVNSVTVSARVYFPAATLANTDYVPTIMWVGIGADASESYDGQLQGIFPWHRFIANWHWGVLFGSVDYETSPVIAPDTWYEIELYVNKPDTDTIDYIFTVDGVEVYNELGVDVSFNPATQLTLFSLGQDGTGFPGDDGIVYFDDATVDGVVVDDFESGTLAAWTDQTGSVTVSTDHAVSGTQSLKSDMVDLAPAFVVRLLTP